MSMPKLPAAFAALAIAAAALTGGAGTASAATMHPGLFCKTGFVLHRVKHHHHWVLRCVKVHHHHKHMKMKMKMKPKY